METEERNPSGDVHGEDRQRRKASLQKPEAGLVSTDRLPEGGHSENLSAPKVRAMLKNLDALLAHVKKGDK